MKGTRTLAAALLLGAALAAGGPAAAQDGDSSLDKALQQVEALLTSLRGKADADPKLVEKLEEIATNLRKEKESRGGGSAAGGGAPAGGGGGGGSDWIVNETKKSFLRGVELSEDEKTVADSILNEFLADYRLAKDHDDEKSRKVVREHTESRIARSFPSRTANRLKDNLDGIVRMWEWRGGRGGR